MRRVNEARTCTHDLLLPQTSLLVLPWLTACSPSYCRFSLLQCTLAVKNDVVLHQIMNTCLSNFALVGTCANVITCLVEHFQIKWGYIYAYGGQYLIGIGLK